MSSLALSRLMQLVSPILPVGAYSYSQGLEWAIESGQVHDAESAKVWISDVLHGYQETFEMPILKRLMEAWETDDLEAIRYWNTLYLAGRDTAEAVLETKQMGYSLFKLAKDLSILPDFWLNHLESIDPIAFPTIYTAVARQWQIVLEEVLHGYAWSWAENQVSVTMKAVPLGQVAGQRLLLHLGAALPDVVSRSMQLPDDEICNFNPLLSIAGCQHETQYSRLFRS